VRNQIFSVVSKVNRLPILDLISPSAARAHSQEEQQGYLESQTLAQRCAREIAGFLQEGWSEKKTADLMEVWLRDHGVKAFFHKPFVWWGDRTRFNGVKTYWDYLPSGRLLCDGEVFILDVAPIYNGYISDVGFTGVLGNNEGFIKARNFLAKLREEIPMLAVEGKNLWHQIDRIIVDGGYDNIHKTYPFGVLGHRLHKNSARLNASFIHFGWQSYWEFLSRGLFGQILNKDFSGSLDGLWAIEPHIGAPGFGAKFEEILVMENGTARWLSESSNI